MSKILIVDDDRDFQESVKAVLEGEGYTVGTASNGAEGIKKAGQWKPDLMLLDVMMTTDSEGFEVARTLREVPETKDLPVILITGIRKAKGLPFSFEPDEDWLPVRAVLEKPVKPESLLKQVKDAIG